MSWFGKKDKEKDAQCMIDEPVLLKIVDKTFPTQIELTATYVVVNDVEEKFKSVLSAEMIKITRIRKISLDKITKMVLKVGEPGGIWNGPDGICYMFLYHDKPHGNGIHFSYYQLGEYEELFKRIDGANYKIYIEKKEAQQEKDELKAIRNLPWYLDNTKLNHIATYRNAEEATRDADAASHAGWVPSGTSATDGHINVGRTATEAVLTGGLTLLLGASRTKGNVTVTYVRTPQWLEEHNMTPKKPEVPINASPNEVITQLERLAKLKDQGILSEEEFQQQKTKIMNS